MQIVHKACPCVLRKNKDGIEILVFKHPFAGWQIPKGTVEAGEALEVSTLRELAEESGITSASIIKKVGTLERHRGSGPQEDGPMECHIWHLFILKPEQTLPEQWDHMAEGSEIESGLTFSFFWCPLDLTHQEHFDPVFVRVLDQLKMYLKQHPELLDAL